VKRNSFRKKLTGILWVLLLCSAAQAQAQDLTKLATHLSAKIQAAKRSRVTVVDFLDLDKKTTKLGKLLAFKLQAALSEPERGLEVVDQSQFAQLMDQMEKLSEGLIDPATGQQLGKMAGTEVLIVGTVMISESSIKLDVRAIDLQTAKMIAAGSDNLFRVGGLLDRLAREAEGDLSETVTAKENQDQPKSAAPVAKSPVRTRRDQGVIFALDGCSLSGDALTCSVTVTSDRDRTIAISFESRSWNTAGAAYEPDEVAIANSRSQDSCAVKEVLKNVPTNVSMIFPTFGGEESMVERLRLYWIEYRYCLNTMRPIDFEKIALSEEDDFSASQIAGHSGSGKSGGKTTAPGKKSGGLLQRVTGKVMETLADTAEKVIDKQAKKLAGDDEEEEDSKKPPQR
jgi:hypothetical protein